MLNIVDLTVYSVAFIALLVGSYTDIKTREVPDWVNYGLIGTGLGLALLFSAVYWNVTFLINSITGLAVFFIIAYIMFYSGQWGGGDSKILMGLGALIGFDLSFKNLFLISFFVNILLVGAVYGILFSLFLAVKHRKKFLIEYRKISRKKLVLNAKKYLVVFLFIILFSLFFIKEYIVKLFLASFLVIFVITFYLWIFIRVVEKACMYKYVKPSELTEGDWIAKDVKLGRKYITGPKDLGIEKKQINKLIQLYKKNKVKKILIKEGIPFVPSFFIAFILTIFFGNLLFLFV
jgi:Flp pilus assembly protein protease CpaA